MPRIRIDNGSNDLLDRLTEVLGGTKNGVASELIRRGAKDLAEDTVGVGSLEELMEKEHDD